MDARLFAVIIAAVVATAGLVTAFIVLKPVTEDSDFSIIDQLENNQVKNGLYYRYVETADNGDGYKAQKTLIIENTKVNDGGIITAKETETNEYENFVVDFSPDAFKLMFFDFTDYEEYPPDVEIEEYETGKWSINGTYIDFDIGFEIKYENVKISDSGDPFEGDITFTMKKLAPTLYSIDRMVSYDDMTYRLGVEDEKTFALAMGTETYEGTDTFTKASQILNRFEKYEISYSDVDEIIFQTTEMYEGSECHKSIVNGTSHSGVVYENYVELYYGDYTVNVEGKRDGFEISAYSKLYYK